MAVPFVYHRTVTFGECDSARTFFSPRVVDYAVEAVEAWFGQVLGVSWQDMFRCHDLEARFVSTDCEYKRPLIAGQTVHVALTVATIGRDTFVLDTLGELEPGNPSFRARLEVGFAAGDSGTLLPIPERFLELIQSCRTCGGTAGSGVSDESGGQEAAVPPKAPGKDSIPATGDGAPPFARQHRVRYGECGISGKIYPPKLVECAVEVVGEWYKECLGISWMQQCISKRGVPFVNIRCSYLRPIEMGQTINVTVRIPRLGSASIGYEVMGYDESGTPCFESQMTACYITQEKGSYQSLPFPEEMRQRITAYQSACGAAI